MTAPSSSHRLSAASLSIRVRFGVVRASRRRLSTSRALSTFQPKASSPISDATKRAGGGRKRLPVSSIRWSSASGAACGAMVAQAPSASRKRTEPSSSATVRPSATGACRPTSAVAMPSRARARAAASPAAPAPTTAASNRTMPDIATPRGIFSAIRAPRLCPKLTEVATPSGQDRASLRSCSRIQPKLG